MLADKTRMNAQDPRQTNTATHATPETCLRMLGVAESRAVSAEVPLLLRARGDSAGLLRAPLAPLFSSRCAQVTHTACWCLRAPVARLLTLRTQSRHRACRCRVPHAHARIGAALARTARVVPCTTQSRLHVVRRRRGAAPRQL
jgi:hypothetical protein